LTFISIELITSKLFYALYIGEEYLNSRKKRYKSEGITQAGASQTGIITLLL
jgi:hypothetical protein